MPENSARRPPIVEGVTLYEHQQAAYERCLNTFGYPPVDAEQENESGEALQSEGGDALCQAKAPVTVFCLSQPRDGAGLTEQVINGDCNRRAVVP